MTSAVSIGPDITFDNRGPFVLIAGMNVIEDKDTLFRVAEEVTTVAGDLRVPLVFKASFDKANRSSNHSYRGPGIDEGLRILQGVKARFGVPLLTDVHEPAQAIPAAEVVDIVQIPAFLARQTDLVAAVARTGVAINVKKPQFLAPPEMRHIIAKCRENGNERVMLCERGSSFGYNNLVVDMLGVDLMKNFAPVVFDVTHSLQQPGGREDSAGGRRTQALALARSAMALGLAGLFVETHPNPDEALCDGPSALPLLLLRPFLEQVVAIDRLVKGFGPLPIA
ncbi:3-deoxy-8-phosphooctulonate synthase [Sphingomonas sp. LY29]|uniref:3-deoxy-8-phosphooctulonate synthase n=1 Tax=Sphingomonas sp. LY29 TaxID=3095341 RepID=UPI002D76C4A2|nr:3-deoxy-8-phosphooctulonate synthase [Sphingomonas sp. LY29]WRP25307.1 3-deoxy-8-phosphooctulonate synthase [Sphingomonas sp. LY29]